VRRVFAEAKDGRRDFLRSAFAAAAAGVAAAIGPAGGESLDDAEHQAIDAICLQAAAELGVAD